MKFVEIGFIVEGDGELAALPILVRRILHNIDETVFMIDKWEPIIVARNTIVKPGVLERYVGIAADKIERKGGILILMDADDDCPAQLGPRLLERAKGAGGDIPIAVVLAMREYEAWFLASATTLRGKCGISTECIIPQNLEAKRDAKGFLTDNMPKGQAYSATKHQTLFTREIDIELARKNSPSFNKLYRDLQTMILQLQETQSLLPGN